MATPGDKSSIGAVSVDVVANTMPLDATLKQAEAKVQASAEKMAAAAVVPIGDKTGARVGGGMGPMPIGDKSGKAYQTQDQINAAKYAAEVANVNANLNEAVRIERMVAGEMQTMNVAVEAGQSRWSRYREGIRGVTFAFTQFLSTAMRIVGVLGLMTGAVAAVVSIFTSYERRVKASRDRTNELTESLQEMTRSHMEQTQGLAGELKRINEQYDEFLRNVAKDAKSGDISKSKANELRARTEAMREIALEEANRAEVMRTLRQNSDLGEERDKANIEKQIERRQRLAEIENEFKELREEQARGAADVEEERFNRRLERLRSMMREVDPTFERRERNNFIAQAWMEAKTPIEQAMIAGLGAAFEKADKNKLAELMKGALESALQASNSSTFGAQHQTTLLRDINMKLQAIQASIPRSH